MSKSPVAAATHGRAAAPALAPEEGTSHFPHNDAVGPASAPCKNQGLGKVVLSSLLGASRNPSQSYPSAKVNEQITFFYAMLISFEGLPSEKFQWVCESFR